MGDPKSAKLKTEDPMPYAIAGTAILPGERKTVDLPVGTTTSHEIVHLRAHVVRGKSAGSTVLVSACVHGDEINGAEIVRRLLRSPSLKKLRGTLIAVPIVNVPAFSNRARYMPDRRDLNRLFPGSPTGSLGARLAHVFLNEIVTKADVVIDLHTGAVNRPNLPQIRTTADDERSAELAKIFDAPVTLLAGLRESSLRAATFERGIPILLFESGEALRLDTPSIRFGLRGTLSVMRHLGLLPTRRTKPEKAAKGHGTVFCKRSSWERAPIGGLFTPLVSLGRAVNTGTVLGFVADPDGTRETFVEASRDGIVIGRTNEGIADEGDGLFHIASFKNPESAEGTINRTANALPSIPAEEDDHPVPYDPFTDVV